MRAAALLPALLFALPATAQTAVPKVVVLPPPRTVSAGPANPDAPHPTGTVRPPAEVSHEAPVNGVLTLYGDQRCPTDTSGNEVVVCVRRGAAEQFRIPKELRDFKVTPQNESWARNQAVTLAAGQSGVGQCVAAVGPSAGTGCLAQQARAAKTDTRERAKDATPDLSGY